ncbi:hypothetical protein SKAU_G00198980 [Synaphobranchus kaupii]|uniref:Uncharacterized protein n=1 Tax=Synaphobranchus kaupii TaxID=118154 RepID=A0A9Q1FF64_SYNKA|nr:hypothetical protein SKAU_G00198980 [Synaphobranchus kaupii]
MLTARAEDAMLRFLTGKAAYAHQAWTHECPVYTLCYRPQIRIDISVWRIKAVVGSDMRIPLAGASRGRDGTHGLALPCPIARPRSGALSRPVTWKTRNLGLLRGNRCAPPPSLPLRFCSPLSLPQDLEVSANYWRPKPQSLNGETAGPHGATDAAGKSPNPEVWPTGEPEVARCRRARLAGRTPARTAHRHARPEHADVGRTLRGPPL